MASVNEAKALDFNATQEEVNAKASRLNGAIEALIVKADLTALNEAIALAESKVEGEYTIISWNALKEALASAKLLDENSDMGIVGNATVALNNAIAGLVLKANLSELNALLGEIALLEKVVDVDEVADLYTNWISDPMKIEVRSKDYAYFLENISDYRDLWIRLGLRYPWEYVKAWVDQTKGYWNAGYDYAMYSETVTDNPYGVEKSGGIPVVSGLFRLYFGLSRHLIFFEPLHSIGLHVWIFLLSLILNIRKKREVWIISMPLLLLLVGMWFGTPVYCCFRYVYPLFVSLPLIVSTSVWKRDIE